MTVKSSTLEPPDLITLVQSLGHECEYRRLDGLYVYVCAICHHVNHVKRITCETCGTVPADYSIIGKPAILHDETDSLSMHFVEVTAAHGCQRLESRRAHKVYFRTVPADYYAESATQQTDAPASNKPIHIMQSATRLRKRVSK